MTINEQYKTFLNQITTRRRSPVKPATLSAYQCYWRKWVSPLLGSTELGALDNGAMRAFVAKLATAGLSASSIAGVTQCVKSIIRSAVDGNGNIMFPKEWNTEFIDAPILDPKAQKAPTVAAADLSGTIAVAPSQYAPIFALLAGSGLRISEVLALKVGPNPVSSYWDPRASKLVVRVALYQGQEQSPKTAAGAREVDLDPALNSYLIDQMKNKQAGDYLFAREDGSPMALQTLRDAANELGIPGFHCLRRFRITYLENKSVPLGLINFWAGHAGKDVHDRYVRLDRDVEARKDWALKAGLGFELPKTPDSFRDESLAQVS